MQLVIQSMNHFSQQLRSWNCIIMKNLNGNAMYQSYSHRTGIMAIFLHFYLGKEMNDLILKRFPYQLSHLVRR